MLASGLSLLLFVALANLVVFQYGKGAVRSALEQGARAGSLGGSEACESTAEAVIGDLLGGQMSEGLNVFCVAAGDQVEARATATFPSWTPFMPDLQVALVARSVAEP